MFADVTPWLSAEPEQTLVPLLLLPT